MMGSWRYHPVSVSDGGQWRSGSGSEAGLCPMCGHRSRSVSRGSRPGTGDRMYNYLAHLPRVEAARSRSRPSEAGRHARLSRTTDVTKLWSSQITEASEGTLDTLGTTHNSLYFCIS